MLVAEEHWTVTDIPEWDLALDGEFLVRVIVEGAPPLRLELRIGNDRIAGLPGVAGGQLAVAMTAIRADPRRAPAAPRRRRHRPGLRRVPLARRSEPTTEGEARCP